MASHRSTQLTLDRGEPFLPLPSGPSHYVAAVQNKAGELLALAHAAPDTWGRLTPLMQVLGPKSHEASFRAERISEWVRKIALAVSDRPFFLDVLRLRATHPTSTRHGDEPVLAVMYAAARKRSLRFVPVLPVSIDGSAAHREIVREAALCDGRGAALRYPVLGIAFKPGVTHRSLLTHALDELKVDPSDADLLVDLGFLSGVEELHPPDMVALLNDLVEVGEWRSLILLGTSMPSALGEIHEGTVGHLPRREWDLWSAIRDGSPARVPTYGDYAIQHPRPPSGGGMGMRANIRYTTGDRTLIARGTGPVVHDTEQYRDLCRQLVARPEFAGPDFSWGDQVIHERASGFGELGAQDLWRGAGTSHHLRLVTDQISR